MTNVSSSNGQEENVPKLRFPGFEGEWIAEKLSDFSERITRKNSNNETDLPLTISSKDGLVDQISYFNKTVASKDMRGYYLLKNGEFAYNKSYSVDFDFGSIKRLDRYSMGALSTLYICFALKKHDTDFIKAYFDSLKWYHEIYMISAEGARNHGLLNVSTDEFFATKHYLPKDIHEQNKIANFLIVLNRRIEMQRTLVKLLKKYKRGLLSNVFPQRRKTRPQYRFAGFTDIWEQRKIKSVAPLQRGFDLPTSQMEEGVYPVVMSNGIGGHHSQYKVKGPGIVTGRSGTIGKLHYIENDYWPHNTTLWVTNFYGNNQKFIYYMYQCLDLSRFSTGSGVPTLNRNDVHDEVVCIPSVGEQKKISDYLTSLDHLITLHQCRLNQLITFKSGLFQQLFI